MLTVYKASAGSGKTYTLAYEYIKLLLGRRRSDGSYELNSPGKHFLPRNHSKILAITFTNKATAEMKSRIIKELYALTLDESSDGKDAPYAAALMAEYKCSRQALRDAARIAFRSLLNDYSAFNVSTIDAFFQTVLRSFAREIDRQGDYRLELDSDTALAQSLAMLFDEINLNDSSPENAEIINWLNEQSSERMKAGSDFNPFNRRSEMYRQIVRHLTGIFNEEFAEYETKMSEYLSDPSRLAKFRKWIAEHIENLKEEEVAVSANLLERGLNLNRNLVNTLNKIIEQGELKDTQYNRFNDSSKPTKYIEEIRRLPDDDPFHIWLKTVETNFQLRSVYDQTLQKTHSLRALHTIFDYIDRYRKDNNLILIADSNSLLRTIVSDSNTPFIYERVGMLLENFLIDEFQDTSRMQWENLKPLVGTSLDVADSLIIGDEKQSIYRFRGGDPNLLAHQVAEKDFKRLSTVKGAAPGENTNYRSAHGIVQFNNTLFRALSSLPDGKVDGYEGVAQTPAKKTEKLTSFVRINNLTDVGFAETAARLLPPEKISEMVNNDVFNPNDVALQVMADTIHDMLSRGYKQSDIAILHATGKEGSVIADYLGRNHKDIKLISEEALLLQSSSSVRLIISILEIIDKSLDASYKMSQSENSHSHEEMFNILGKNVDKSRLQRAFLKRRQRLALADNFEYFIARDIPAPEALRLALEATARITENDSSTSSEPESHEIAHDLEQIRKIAPANLSALIQAIIELKITEDERRREMPYITAFVDLVDEFMQNGNPSVHSFLAYWNETKDKAVIAPGMRENAVTISTVHKAKGLEWPCVLIPFMNWTLSEAPRSGWFTTSDFLLPEGIKAPPIIYLDTNKYFGCPKSPFLKQFEKDSTNERTDNLNMAYVAFTRAVRELHVNLMVKPKKPDPLANHIIHIFSNPPAVDPHDNKFIDLAPFISDDRSLCLGNPTFPEMENDRPDDHALPEITMTDFFVSFNDLNRRLTTHIDLTTASDGADIDITDPDEDSSRLIVDEPVSPQMEKAARDGIVLHAILSRTSTLSDLDDAIEYYRGTVDDADLDLYRQYLEKAFDEGGDKVRQWFSENNIKILTEQSIFSRSTEKITRADRIVFLPDGSVAVIDYKFTSAEKPAHHSQVRDYANAIASMKFGKVTAWLWYPLLNRIVKVCTIG